MKLHLKSSHHLKMQSDFGSNNTGEASYNFEKEFTDLFRYKYGKAKWIPINKVYNELIHDRHHTHLSATRWGSLNGFAAYL